MTKNWKTTFAGLFFSLGTALTTSQDELLRHIGTTLVAAAGLLGFFFAKDRNVTGVGPYAKTENEL